MTTWMTPTGMALIVSGISMLIAFRATLFSRTARDRPAARNRHEAGAGRPARRRAGAREPVRRTTPVPEQSEPTRSDDHEWPGVLKAGPLRDAAAPDPSRKRSRRRRFAALDEAGLTAGPGGPTDVSLLPLIADLDDPDPGVPADRHGDPELDIDEDLDRAADSVGEPCPAPEPEGPDFTGSADQTAYVPVTEAAVGADWVDRSDVRYGDRVQGWVRPDYRDEPQAVAGDYWTPVPTGSYATEYGWPTPVARLPEVPLDPPQSSYELPTREDDLRPVEPAVDHRPVVRTVGQDNAGARRFAAEVASRPDQSARRRFDRAVDNQAQRRDDRAFLGREGLVLNRPYSPVENDNGRRASEPPAATVQRGSDVASRGRVRAADPGRRDKGPFSARAESIDGPIWTVRDLPEAALPELTWRVGGVDESRPRRPRRSGGTARRPRPRPGQTESLSAGYLSRHAAEPR